MRTPRLGPGQRAQSERCEFEALPFIQKHLSSPENIHRVRHAWCAVASLLATLPPETPVHMEINLCDWQQPAGKVAAGAPREIETVELRSFVKERLEAIVLEGLEAFGDADSGRSGLPTLRDPQESRGRIS